MYERAADRPEESPQASFVPMPEDTVPRPDLREVPMPADLPSVVCESVGSKALDGETAVDLESVEPSGVFQGLIDMLAKQAQGSLHPHSFFVQKAFADTSGNREVDGKRETAFLGEFLEDPRVLRWHEFALITNDTTRRAYWQLLMEAANWALDRISARHPVFEAYRFHAYVRSFMLAEGRQYGQKTAKNASILLRSHAHVKEVTPSSENTADSIPATFKYAPPVSKEAAKELQASADFSAPSVAEEHRIKDLKRELRASLHMGRLNVSSVRTLHYELRHTGVVANLDHVRQAVEEMEGALVLKDSGVVLYGGNADERQRLNDFSEIVLETARQLAEANSYAPISAVALHTALKVRGSYGKNEQALATRMARHHNQMRASQPPGKGLLITVIPPEATETSARQEAASKPQPASEVVSSEASPEEKLVSEKISEVALIMADNGFATIPLEKFRAEVEKLTGVPLTGALASVFEAALCSQGLRQEHNPDYLSLRAVAIPARPVPPRPKLGFTHKPRDGGHRGGRNPF